MGKIRSNRKYMNRIRCVGSTVNNRALGQGDNSNEGSGQAIVEKARPPPPPRTRITQEACRRGNRGASSTGSQVIAAPEAMTSNKDSGERTDGTQKREGVRMTPIAPEERRQVR